jgi:hypothetical protein
LKEYSKSKWAASQTIDKPTDHIQTYLKEDTISAETIKEAGGYMKYWFQARHNQPVLSKMGQDFCSAPGMTFVIILNIT